MANAPTVASFIVRTVLRGAEAHGLSPDELLHAVRASPEAVADLDRRFPLSRFRMLVGEVTRRSRDPALCLKIGLHATVGATGLVGYAAMSAGTLGAALGVLERYRRIVSDEIHLYVGSALSSRQLFQLMRNWAVLVSGHQRMRRLRCGRG
jgi:Arabinose-binding domain of AraC transcription regulator, N-term